MSSDLPELVNPRVWPVESSTRPGLIHLVVYAYNPHPTVKKWGWHCTCEATVTDCRHVREKRQLVTEKNP